jgi:hypothetical protein
MAKYIYHTIKALGNRKAVNVKFLPSTYLKDVDEIWTLIVVGGEKPFLKMLKEHGYFIDAPFIEALMEQCNTPFYVSANGKMMFPAAFDETEKNHGPLKRITAREALEFASVPVLEDMIEKNRTFQMKDRRMKPSKRKYRVVEVAYDNGDRAFFPQMLKKKKGKEKWVGVTKSGWLSLDAANHHIARHIRKPEAVDTIVHDYDPKKAKAPRKASP